MNEESIGVVGAGTMGHGIAQAFIIKGYPVILADIDPQRLEMALNQIKASIEKLSKKKVITTTAAKKAMSLLQTSVKLESLKASALVVEAATEKFDVKAELFCQLDTICEPSTILASNTSSISLTKLASITKRPQQVVGMHFMNPVPLMKLVEIIRAKQTSEEVFQIIFHLAEKLDKVPVCSEDYPGFISNRILMPMINEAIFTLFEGVGTAEDIDQVMKLGMNHPIGPLALADLIGLDTCLAIIEVLHNGFGDSKYRPCPLLKQMVDAGNLGRKTGEGFYRYDE